MRPHHTLSLLRLGMVLACVSLLAACTKGGQFDPTTLLDNDMFDTKKPLQGQREPVFPGGVPGADTGIPADLYKGYQPPPDEAATGAATPLSAASRVRGKARRKAQAESKTQAEAQGRACTRAATNQDQHRHEEAPARGRAAGRASSDCLAGAAANGCVADRVASAAADRRWPAGRPAVPVAVDLA